MDVGRRAHAEGVGKSEGEGEGEGEAYAHHVQLATLPLTTDACHNQGTMAMRAGRFDLAMPNVAKAYELFMKEHHFLDESQRNGMLQALTAVKDKFGELSRGETWEGGRHRPPSAASPRHQ